MNRRCFLSIFGLLVFTISLNEYTNASNETLFDIHGKNTTHAAPSILSRNTWLSGLNSCKNMTNLQMASADDIEDIENESYNFTFTIEEHFPLWVYGFEITEKSTGKTFRIKGYDVQYEGNIYTCTEPGGSSITACCTSIKNAESTCRHIHKMDFELPEIHLQGLMKFSTNLYINATRIVKVTDESEFQQDSKKFSVRCLLLDENGKLKTDRCDEKHRALCIPGETQTVLKYVKMQRIPQYTPATTQRQPSASNETVFNNQGNTSHAEPSILSRNTWLSRFNSCKNMGNLQMASEDDIEDIENEKYNFTFTIEEHFPLWVYGFEVTERISGKTFRIKRTDVLNQDNLYTCKGPNGSSVTTCCTSFKTAQSNCRQQHKMDIEIPKIHLQGLMKFSNNLYINATRLVKITDESEFQQDAGNLSVRCLLLDENGKLKTDRCDEKHRALCIPGEKQTVLKYVKMQRIPQYTPATTQRQPSVSNLVIILPCGIGGLLFIILVVIICVCQYRRKNKGTFDDYREPVTSNRCVKDTIQHVPDTIDADALRVKYNKRGKDQSTNIVRRKEHEQQRGTYLIREQKYGYLDLNLVEPNVQEVDDYAYTENTYPTGENTDIGQVGIKLPEISEKISGPDGEGKGHYSQLIVPEGKGKGHYSHLNMQGLQDQTYEPMSNEEGYLKPVGIGYPKPVGSSGH